MLRDHRPYRVKKAYVKLSEFYVEHFLRPQFTSLGKGHTFIRPWNVELFGEPIEIGDYVNVIAARDRKAAGPTAPAQGLCLQWVRYPAELLRPAAEIPTS